MNARACVLITVLTTLMLLAPPAQAETIPTANWDVAGVTIVTSNGKQNRVQKPSSAQRFDRRRRASDFVDQIKTVIRDRGPDLCSRYGGEPDCIEEIEICFSMLDKDDDLMKICLNTAPEGRGPSRAEKTRLRR